MTSKSGEAMFHSTTIHVSTRGRGTYDITEQLQRRLQPLSRTNAHGRPAKLDSPCTEQ